MINVESNNSKRICQGDIFRHVECIDSVEKKNNHIIVNKIDFPLVVILTQDCDLNSDQRNRDDNTADQLLLSVLVAPLYNAATLRQGKHLEELRYPKDPLNPEDIENPIELKLKSLNGKIWDTVKKNNNSRYHYIIFPPELQLPDSVIDFKHYFSVNVEKLITNKKDKFHCKLSELYREDLSLRFANFLSRIALPDP